LSASRCCQSEQDHHRTPKEQVKPLRKIPPGEFETIRRKILRWVTDHKDQIANAEPKVLDSFNDRAADNWFPLLDIAWSLEAIGRT
jgi:hypothetical protein